MKFKPPKDIKKWESCELYRINWYLPLYFLLRCIEFLASIFVGIPLLILYPLARMFFDLDQFVNERVRYLYTHTKDPK